MRTFLLLAAIATVHAASAADLIQEGSFTGGSAGDVPPSPWTIEKSGVDISVTLATLPDSSDKTLWAHFTDDSTRDAASLTQKFEPVTAGRLSCKLHIVKSNAAIWFLLGGRELRSRTDIVFNFKINSKGSLLTSAADRKLANEKGGTPPFLPGQTYDIYCSFKPTDDQSGSQIEIGLKDGAILFSGKIPSSEPISAIAIRTHGEEAGSDFYITDIALNN